MKKSLVLTLALIFVLGIASTALAANPFTDVPANHWAYASVSKLADAGIIDGYGDGTFVGQRNMTRYEMAQIIAKAMARSDKADSAMQVQIEKLAAEFGDELNGLGVRTARLAKNSDNVKIVGEARFASHRSELFNGNDKSEFDSLRTRLWLTGQVNERWSYSGMIEQHQNLRTNSNNDGETRLRRAWVDGSIGDVKITAGAFNKTTMMGTVLDNDMDGLNLGYGKGKFNLDLFVGRIDYSNQAYWDQAFNGSLAKGQTYGAVLGYDFTDKLNMQAAYYSTEGMGAEGDIYGLGTLGIIEVGAGYKFAKNWQLWAEYLRADNPYKNWGFDAGKNGWAALLSYDNTDRNKAGGFGFRANYYDVPAGGSLAFTGELWTDFNYGAGFKGYQLGLTYMLAKNIDVNFDYYEFKTNDELYYGEKIKDKLYFSYVRFYF